MKAEGSVFYKHKPIAGRCIHAVSNGARTFDWHQCERVAVAGNYCVQHSSDATKAREQKRSAKYDAETAVMQRRARRLENYFTLLKAAKEHCAGKLSIELLRRLVTRIERTEENKK